jgi:flavin reductase (DIM6/NTAB) family NADH-FMN oxidoreductase RutF
MISIDPQTIETRDLHQFMLAIVSPRPIAFASTISPEGVPNLAPYSFFNAFSSNPPIVVFSSNRRVEDNTTKDTLYNIRETGEVVINAVSYDIVRQMAVTSVEFPADVSEFDKAGLTPVPSDLVKPFRVAESPAAMECKVTDIITLGENGGAGHLIICNVVKIHVSEQVVDERNRIDPDKIDLVGRMGRQYYVRASGDAVFTLEQSVKMPAIGFDGLPTDIRNSEVLTGNDLGTIAGMATPPSPEEIEQAKQTHSQVGLILGRMKVERVNATRELHLLASSLFKAGKAREAAAVLWSAEGS